MSKLFVDNGLLSDQGKQLVEPVQQALNAVLNTSEVKSLSTSEIQALKANLAKMIGDNILDYVSEKSK